MAAAIVLSFHYSEANSEDLVEWVCIPGFLRQEQYPALLRCMQRKVRILEAEWGVEMAARVLEACGHKDDVPLPTCSSVGLDRATHRYVIHEAVELLVRHFVPQARFGSDILFLHSSEGLPNWKVVKEIESIQQCLGIAEHASLGVWALMPVFSGILMGLAEFGRKNDWLPQAWARLSDEEKAGVAGALQNEHALKHISDTLDEESLEALEALAGRSPAAAGV